MSLTISRQEAPTLDNQLATRLAEFDTYKLSAESRYALNNLATRVLRTNHAAKLATVIGNIEGCANIDQLLQLNEKQAAR